ncbi:hypothetical protein HNQ56_000472 [Anaerotaenia torta]|uniref:hypothetical protein n=1 Tax=Anaerotaenia torta TaxID=433293 RepID=UPI003D231324
MEIFIVDGAGVCDIPSDDGLNKREIELLLSHTTNTWQKGRERSELERDTIQGKKAEFAFEKFIEKYTDVRFLSYDSFRGDHYLSHAPFDGLVYKAGTPSGILEAYIEKINAEVAGSNNLGIISTDLKREMEESGLFSIEIKSSVLKGNLGDFKGTSGSIPRTEEDYGRIIKNIERWDFFVYPHYCRSNEEIKSFYDYASYVKDNYQKDFPKLTNEVFLKRLMQIEFDHASDVYTRLYFDYDANKLYIPGYVLKEDFFKQPCLLKMPGNKSGKALYYMHSIADRTSFCEINGDSRIWEFDHAMAYTRLFAGERKFCKGCGNPLFLCDSKKNCSYYYRCFDCNRTYDMKSV